MGLYWLRVGVDLSELAIDRLRMRLRYKALYHVGNNCADVEDLVQESLMRFLQAEQRNLIRNTEEFGRFLNGVCRNVILEYFRQVKRQPVMDSDVPVPNPGVRPDAEVLEMRDAIDHGLAELSERDRMILRSLYLDGQRKEDICRKWGLSDTQFRNALSRAKRRFRRTYDSSMKSGARN